MSPITGVTYSRVHPNREWTAKGRVPLLGDSGPAGPWINPKDTGGLVCVVGSNMANVSSYGVNHYVGKASDGISWAAIEPTQGDFNWAPIDNALAAHGSGKGMTLRIQAGSNAPGWLKTLTGTVNVDNQSRTATANCAHWWEDVALDAWQNMILAAGARYDGDPRVVMVSADEPMVVYSEPFILGNDKNSCIRLYTAGLNLATMKNAITRCVDDTIAAFPHTLVELAIHSDLQYPIATGVARSWPEGRGLALSLATKHGRHLCLSDYGLGSTEGGRTPTGSIFTEPEAYAWMSIRAAEANRAQPWAGPVTFQLTVGKEPQVQATYVNAALAAIGYGGQQCETAGWGLAADRCEDLNVSLNANAQRWSLP